MALLRASPPLTLVTAWPGERMKMLFCCSSFVILDKQQKLLLLLSLLCCAVLCSAECFCSGQQQQHSSALPKTSTQLQNSQPRAGRLSNNNGTITFFQKLFLCSQSYKSFIRLKCWLGKHSLCRRAMPRHPGGIKHRFCSSHF